MLAAQARSQLMWCSRETSIVVRIILRQERQIPTVGHRGEFCMNSGVIQSVVSRRLAFWVDSPPALSHWQGRFVSSLQSLWSGLFGEEKVRSTSRAVFFFHVRTNRWVWFQPHKWGRISNCCRMWQKKDLNMVGSCKMQLLCVLYWFSESVALMKVHMDKAC